MKNNYHCPHCRTPIYYAWEYFKYTKFDETFTEKKSIINTWCPRCNEKINIVLTINIEPETNTN